MTLLVSSLVIGIFLFLLGIWLMFATQQREEAALGVDFTKCVLYRKKIYAAIALAIMGFFSVWIVAATHVNVVHSAAVEVLDSVPGRMVVGLGIQKQRGCKLESLTIKSLRYPGQVEVSTLAPPALISNMADGYSPDFLIIELNRDDTFTIRRVEFSATYSCPFGLEVYSQVGSLTPDQYFNQTTP